MPKYDRYQDYVIKEGQLVGEFEQMYKDFDDPWEQSSREKFASEKSIGINAINSLNIKKVVEFGCGFGHYTRSIKNNCIHDIDVIGVDISETAINKATQLHQNCNFYTGDITDLELIKKINPEMIIFSEITWYVLDNLNNFKKMLKENFPNIYFLHLLNFYPQDEQKYGREYFTNLSELLAFFDMNYIEYGSITKPFHGNCSRSYFLGKYGSLESHYNL